MKAAVELWVRLKVTDLVAGTAWMTLTEKMDFASSLFGVARYSYWRMNAEGGSPGSIMENVGKVIRSDSAFTNQNKHFFRLTVSGEDGSGLLESGSLRLDKDYAVNPEAPEPGPGRRVFACDLLVRERGGDKDRGYSSRLNDRLEGITVSGLRSGEVWRLIVAAEDEDQARTIVEKMAVTRSRRQGLLLNPHYQEYEFLGIIEVLRQGDGVS
jgi:phosphoribosylformylglycinamidine (FGAM) synthase PurS component